MRCNLLSIQREDLQRNGRGRALVAFRRARHSQHRIEQRVNVRWHSHWFDNGYYRWLDKNLVFL